MRYFPFNLFRPRSLQNTVSSFSFGMIAGIQTVFLQVSLAALIFSGPLQEFAAQGMGLFLFGTMVMIIGVALTSSCATSIAYVQEAPVAILGVNAAVLTTRLVTTDAEQLFATVVATTLVSTMLTGLCFWLLGHFRLGRLVRFIPYPVGGGFLAGTGWLLVIGGIGVMTDASGMALLQPAAIVRWLPGLLFGVTLLLLLRRYSHALLLPALLVVSIVLFYLIYALSTGSVTLAESQGWLLGPFPVGNLWPSPASLVVLKADWGAVAQNGISMTSIALVSVVSLLLNASGLEINTRQDLDLNQELRSAGIMNLLAGLGGSPVGFHSLSLSSLGYRLGVRNHLGGLFAGGLIGLTLLLGADILAFFPRLIAGGFLIFLGLCFLEEWVYDTWTKLPRLDYLLIWAILIVIVTVGLLQGIALGIMISALLFLVSYSKINVIRHATTRADYTSTTLRAPLYEELLGQRGENIAIVTLQGYLFFGTAYQLVEQLKSRLSDPVLPPWKFLVLDFRLVTGIDSSATFSFARLKQSTTIGKVQVVLTGLSPTLQNQLALAIAQPDPPPWKWLPTLAEGVSWCEERMIDTFVEVGLADRSPSVLDLMKERLGYAEETVDWLDYLDPTHPPSASTAYTIFMDYLDRIEFQGGDQLLIQGGPVDGLYFLEKGSVTYQTSQGSAQCPPTQVGRLEAGTVLALTAFYADQPSAQTLIAASDGMLYHLSREALKAMETDHPDVAIALHRILAAQISWRASRTEEAAKALLV